MDFGFSEEQLLVQTEIRRLLSAESTPVIVRKTLDGHEPYSRALWSRLCELGFVGIAIPEEFGGVGAGYLELCLVAEELGGALATVPFASTVYWTADLIVRYGSQEQKEKWLPRIAAGDAIGCVAFAEGSLGFSPGEITTYVDSSGLHGRKSPVLDGGVADFAIVLARDKIAGDLQSLYIVTLDQSGTRRKTLRTIDPTRNQASLDFSGASAEILGDPGKGWAMFRRALDRVAVLIAFEQLGGATAALSMARDYSLSRHAFGRPIGSFQALKHKLVDVYVANELARSNCLYGAWALSTDGPDLSEAAAAARISASEAFRRAAIENNQVHGGFSFTWEYDCQLYHRRANMLAVCIGGTAFWSNSLIESMSASNVHGEYQESTIQEKAA